MKFLVIKHVVVEGLGVFESLCDQANIDVDYVELEKGDSFPALEGYSALWIMGGPMNVGDTDDYPWLVDEKQLIRQAIQDYQLPFMGICLGSQLLADALGGTVGAMATPEVGLLPIELTAAGQTHPLLAGLPKTYPVLHWHGQEVKQVPPGATILAASPQCSVQAFAVNARTFGIQFHSEVTEVTVGDWVQIPAYRADLEATLGPTGCDDLHQAVVAQLPQMNQAAKTTFENFLKIINQS